MIEVNATVSINGGDPVRCGFGVHVERVDVSSFGHYEPDQSWEWVDPAGHYHAFDHDGQLPTLVSRVHEEPPEDEPVEVAEPTAVDDGDDYWDEFAESYPETRSHCLLCDAEVEPRYRYVDTSGYHQYAPGRTSYELSVDGPVPTERFSVAVTIGDKVYFGFAAGAQAYVPGHGAAVPCGPMSWRKKTVVPTG